MKALKKGFTLVEVALFLAVSGAILAGIIITTSGIISNQRYDDSMQNYMEFLRSIYSSVSNPTGSKDGRSEKSIYGKLITFGEKIGEEKKDYIYVYNVIGDISDKSIGGDVLSSLRALNLNVFGKNNEGNYSLIGNQQKYILNWDAKIKNTESRPLTGSILIVRAPSTGTVYTFYSNKVYEINQKIEEGAVLSTTNPLKDITDDFVQNQDIDFCIAPEGRYLGHKPYDVRIIRNAHNTSSIIYLSYDDVDNRCGVL